MTPVQTFLILMLLVVLIASSLSTYKIETFTNDNNIPESPNDLSAYNFLLKVKNWNVRSLTNEQLFVLFTMRALLSNNFIVNNREFTFINSVVIPYVHLPIFNKDDRKQMVFDVNNKKVIAKPTEEDKHPSGLYFDLSQMTFEDFKVVLDKLYLEYDSEFLEEIKNLEERKKEINEIIGPLEKDLVETRAQATEMETKAKLANEAYEKEVKKAEALSHELAKYRACG